MTGQDVQELGLLVVGICFGIMLAILYASVAGWWEIKQANKAAADEQLRGMIWWLATEIAADTPEDDTGDGRNPEVWVELAERFWLLGLRYQSRDLTPKEVDK